MIRSEEVFKIGRLGKTHGVKGEISFQFDDDIFDRVDADYLVIEVDGILVPFFFEEYRFKSDSVAVVKFCDIDTQEQALELTGCDVFFPRELAATDEENMSWAQIAGYKLFSNADGKEIGEIRSVDDTTLNVLFEMADGKLIPAAEELITDIDHDKKAIYIDLPEGILEI